MTVPVTATHFKTISNLTKLTLLTANMFIMSFYNIKLRCVWRPKAVRICLRSRKTPWRGGGPQLCLFSSLGMIQYPPGKAGGCLWGSEVWCFCFDSCPCDLGQKSCWIIFDFKRKIFEKIFKG